MNAGYLSEGHMSIVTGYGCFPGPEVMIIASVYAFDPPDRHGP